MAEIIMRSTRAATESVIFLVVQAHGMRAGACIFADYWRKISILSVVHIAPPVVQITPVPVVQIAPRQYIETTCVYRNSSGAIWCSDFPVPSTALTLRYLLR
ncbi:hypothetical protein [Novosphingobium sp. MD-1]|uniref:hypothetical protein n=1 Tax=Novosphingobium sp. MD-1 TaxID=1630648 RepID=UPI000F7FAA0F|nr:hypothetical protein [Novosphingobium sp. MD-1]